MSALNEVGNSALINIGAGNAASIVPLAALSVASQPLVEEMQKIYKAAIVRNLDAGTGEEVTQDQMNAALSYQIEAVNKFNQTTQKEIISAVDISMDVSPDIGDDSFNALRIALIASLVRSVFKNLKEKRSKLISETAVVGAYNTGLFDSARVKQLKTNKTLYKTWRTMGDAKVRESHRDLDGTTVPVNSPFITDGIPLRFPRDPLSPPGLTINCRCYLSFSK